MNRTMPIVATFQDEYGETRHVIKRRPGVLKVLRQNGPTPIMALNSAIQAVVMRRIKQLRIECGWTLKQMSERIGHQPPDKNRMWSLENNITDGFSVGTIYAMAIALDVPVTDLLPTAGAARELARVEIRGDALKLKVGI